MALRVDAHEIGAAPAAQRHFRQAPDVVTSKKPPYSARHIGGDERKSGRNERRISFGHRGIIGT